MGSMIQTIRRRLGRRTAAGPVEAIWRGAVIATSSRTVVVEGNHYFPLEDVDFDHLQPSDKHTTCFWKGRASYYDVVVDGERNRAAAWFYPSPSPAARRIKDHVAFWGGVKVRRTSA